MSEGIYTKSHTTEPERLYRRGNEGKRSPCLYGLSGTVAAAAAAVVVAAVATTASEAAQQAKRRDMERVRKNEIYLLDDLRVANPTLSSSISLYFSLIRHPLSLSRLRESESVRTGEIEWNQIPFFPFSPFNPLVLFSVQMRVIGDDEFDRTPIQAESPATSAVPASAPLPMAASDARSRALTSRRRENTRLSHISPLLIDS